MAALVIIVLDRGTIAGGLIVTVAVGVVVAMAVAVTAAAAAAVATTAGRRAGKLEK
jgi:hypothetical protein